MYLIHSVLVATLEVASTITTISAEEASSFEGLGSYCTSQ